MVLRFYLVQGGEAEGNIGLDIGLEGGEVNKIVNMKLIIVSPESRGNGLKMIVKSCCV